LSATHLNRLILLAVGERFKLLVVAHILGAVTGRLYDVPLALGAAGLVIQLVFTVHNFFD